VRRWILLAGLLVVTFSVHAAPDARVLLKQSDHSRGGGLPGIIWEIRLATREGEKQGEPQRLRVKAITDASVAVTLSPPRFQGAKLLQVGRNMWLTKPGLSKPIPISPRQRMSGQAANGDIAATNYANDYDAEWVGEEVLNGEPCYILALHALHKRTTYDRVRYWVSAPRQVGVRAEFYSLSGKLIKSAAFEYGNHVEYRGRRIPFISRMTIRDALIDSETVMEFGEVTVQGIPAFEFDIGQTQ